MIELSAKGILALSHIYAERDIRYYLNEAVHCVPAAVGGALLFSTDGHMAAAYHDKDAKVDGPITLRVGKDAVKHLKSTRSRKSGQFFKFVTVDPSNHRLIVYGADNQDEGKYFGAKELFLQPGSALVEGNFPDVQRVFSPFVDAALESKSPVLNGSYLWRATQAFLACSESTKWVAGIRLHARDEDHAVVVRCALAPDLTVLIMPMRDDSSKAPAIRGALADFCKKEAA